MPLIQYACAHCGFWQPWFAGQQPIGCPVCMDVRNALPPDGWDFRTVEDLTGSVTTHWAEAMPGIIGFSCDPAFGLGSTGWLLLRDEGNIAFEALRSTRRRPWTRSRVLAASPSWPAPIPTASARSGNWRSGSSRPS